MGGGSEPFAEGDAALDPRDAPTLLRPDSIADSGEPDPIDRSDPVAAGRYRLGAPLGHGSMGVVYRGHDPELGRDVAVKVLLRAGTASDGSDVDRRLLREARALAHIEHPNVLPCYDVGTLALDGRRVAYVVTELVDGTTLATFIESKRRHWNEIVDVFVPAARGLAAVHDAGFVHRDFKPSNVLIGRDGRVMVSDFGLAQPSATPRIERESDERTLTSSAEHTASTTTIAGTLAYMAPEQQRGRRCDPAADQFAFCAALYEALTGRRPFGRGTWDEIWAAKATGPPGWPRHGVPRWLEAVVQRGLDPDAPRRHVSMTAIADALEAGRRRRSSRTAAIAVAVVAAGAMLGLAALRPSAWTPEPTLAEPAITAAAGGREAIVREALLRIKTMQLEGQLHEADAFAGMFVDDIDSPALAAELLHRRGNIALVLGRIEEAEELLSRAVAVGTPAGNDFTVAAAANLLVYLTGVHQHRLDGALEWARHAEAALQRIGGNDRERAVLLYSLGTARAIAGEYAKAIEDHEAALRIRERIFGPRAIECAESHHGLGTALAQYGRRDAALEHFEHALAIEEAVHGYDSPIVAQTLDNVASTNFFLGEIEGALEYNERAGRLLALAYPDGDPKRLSNRENRAVMLEAAGRLEEAKAELEAVVEERIAQQGPSHPDVSSSLGSLGRLALRLEHWEEAEELFVRALAMQEAIDPRHPNTAGPLAGLASVRLARHQPESAIEPLERALQNLGKDGDPWALADAEFLLARALDALDRDPTRVASLARSAAATYRDVAPENVAEVEAFLRR